MWQIMVFFLGTLVIAAVSWRVFSNPRSHRFLRFLAFVTMWGVFTINAPWWFREVFTLRQIVSWTLLFGSLGLAISGFLLLLTAGRPSRKRPSAKPAPGLTSRLVTTGPFRYVRHPIYASLILLVWGMGLKSGSFASIFFSLLATGFLYLTALLEEEENLDRFGEAYTEYMTKTRMFVPWVF